MSCHVENCGMRLIGHENAAYCKPAESLVVHVNSMQLILNLVVDTNGVIVCSGFTLRSTI